MESPLPAEHVELVDQHDVEDEDEMFHKLNEESRKLILELEALQAEVLSLEEQDRSLRVEVLKADDTELEEQGQLYRQVFLEKFCQRDSHDRIKAQIRYCEKEIMRLKNLDVVSDLFSVGVNSEGIGTINGLRLGRKANLPVEWDEINSAWGYAVQLLEVLCQTSEIELVKYGLIPRGANSAVLDKRSGKSYSLQGSEVSFFGALVPNRSFDMGMVIFCQAVLEFWQALKSRFKRRNAHLTHHLPQLPYEILNDQVGSISIRSHFAKDEVWSRALRNLLLDLKFLAQLAVSPSLA